MSLFTDACKPLGAIADLERRGCRVLSAHILPSPAIRIDRPAGTLGTYAYRPLPRGACHAPVECCAQLGGVRVTWYACGVRHG